MQPLKPTDPRVVGRYRLEGRLGAGGMGVVYRGSSPGGRPVAVKVVHEHLLDRDPSFRSRFRREIAAAQKVGGFWTAAVIEGDADAPSPWYASAYIEAPTLHAVVAERPLSEPEALRLGAQLAEALQAIHAAGLVHRDLKPSNVLMADDGPRVIDFGIVRSEVGVGDPATPTPTGHLVGTPGYLAPEQLESGTATAATDVFALGALLVYATTRRLPFRGDTEAALMVNTMTTEPELGAVPPRLRSVVARCLAKDPRSRPTMDQLVEQMIAGPVPAAIPVRDRVGPARPPTRSLTRQAQAEPLNGAREEAGSGDRGEPRARDEGGLVRHVSPTRRAKPPAERREVDVDQVATPGAGERWLRPGGWRVLWAGAVAVIPVAMAAWLVKLLTPVGAVIAYVALSAAASLLIEISVQGYEDRARRNDLGGAAVAVLVYALAVPASGLVLSLQRVNTTWYGHVILTLLAAGLMLVVGSINMRICNVIADESGSLGASFSGLVGLALALTLIWGGGVSFWVAASVGIGCAICVGPVIVKLIAPNIVQGP